MLTSRHLEMLKEEQGIEPWHFEQYEHEAVFIPAGCPHQVGQARAPRLAISTPCAHPPSRICSQVRNLRSCTKIAVDFVSPESIPECLKLCGGLRRIQSEDKLQVRWLAACNEMAAGRCSRLPVWIGEPSQIRLGMMWSAQWACQQLVTYGALSEEAVGKELFDRLVWHAAAELAGSKDARKSNRRRKPKQLDAAPGPEDKDIKESPVTLAAANESRADREQEASAKAFKWTREPGARSVEDFKWTREPNTSSVEDFKWTSPEYSGQDSAAKDDDRQPEETTMGRLAADHRIAALPRRSLSSWRRYPRTAAPVLSVPVTTCQVQTLRSCKRSSEMVEKEAFLS